MWAEELDPRVDSIVAKTIGIDTHNHIDLPMTPADLPGPQIDLVGEMSRSGLSAICATFATDYEQGAPYERFETALTAMDKQLELNHMKRALNLVDIRSAHGGGRKTVIQSVEGAHFLEGQLDRLKGAYDRGLRHLGVLHDSDASVPLGDVYTNAPKLNGLTPFGADVIREANRLGMLVDLAHGSKKTTADAVKFSKTPILISHTGPDWRLGSNERMAQMMRPRLISKEHAKLVADAGGAVGVWLHLTDTPLEYAQNLRAMVDVIGVEHVCVGTDTKLTPATPRKFARPANFPKPPQQNGTPPGQNGTQTHAHPGERTNLGWEGETQGFYYVVADAMLKVGFTPEEIAKIGGDNYLRLFEAATQ